MKYEKFLEGDFRGFIKGINGVVIVTVKESFSVEEEEGFDLYDETAELKPKKYIETYLVEQINIIKDYGWNVKYISTPKGDLKIGQEYIAYLSDPNYGANNAYVLERIIPLHSQQGEKELSWFNTPRFILFLDFDGVTHPNSCRSPCFMSEVYEKKGVYFRQENVDAVNRLARGLNASIVISSSWRLNFGFDIFNEFFYGRIIGQTPWLDFKKRYEEVDLYLEQLGWQDVPWLALDDNLHYPEHYPAHLTDGSIGLTEADVDKLILQYTIVKDN